MRRAGEIMHRGAQCIREDQTLAEAAQMMREQQVGALPICGTDDRLHGIVTDRDIVVRCVADGMNPQQVTCGELAQGTPIWVDFEADEDEVIRLMTNNKIRRLPVIENHRIVGMISEADVARNLDDDKVAEFAGAIYTAPPSI